MTNSLIPEDKSEEAQKPKSLARMKRYEDNPFVKAESEYTRAKKRTVVKGGKAIIDQETGEYENTAEITTVRTVDAEQFIKIYPAYAGRIFSLKPSTQKIFGVVLNELQDNPKGDKILLNEKIIISHLEQMGEKAPSKSAIYTSLAEMCAKNILARCELDKNLYFINLNIFFNGDRIKFVEEWHIERKQRDLFKEQTVERRQMTEQQVDVEDYISQQNEIDKGGF